MKNFLVIFTLIAIFSNLNLGLSFFKIKDIDYLYIIDNNQVLDSTNLERDSLIEEPRFPGCEGNKTVIQKRSCAWKAMRRYISSNLTYPENAKKLKTEGKVLIEVLIRKDGSLTNPKIIEDIGDGCAEAAIEVINKMPKWIPGKENGEVKEMVFSISFRFSLRSPNRITKVVKEMPIFKECNSLATYKEKRNCSDKKMFEYIYSKIKYPKEAIEKNIEGDVTIKYIVAPDGFLYNFSLSNDIGGGCGENVLKVFKSLPDFIPGKFSNGKSTAIGGNTFKIKFSLKEDNESLKHLEILNDENKSILIKLKTIDGFKVITKEEAKKLSRNYIHYIDFFDQEPLIRKYGEVAKDGYMIIHERTLKSIVIRPDDK